MIGAACRTASPTTNRRRNGNQGVSEDEDPFVGAMNGLRDIARCSRWMMQQYKPQPLKAKIIQLLHDCVHKQIDRTSGEWVEQSFIPFTSLLARKIH